MNKKRILNFLKSQKELIIGKTLDGILIIKAWKIDDRHVSLYCPYCKEIHNHGWANGFANGYRVSHCLNRTGMRIKKDDLQSGYFLVCMGEITEEILDGKYLHQQNRIKKTEQEVQQ